MQERYAYTAYGVVLFLNGSFAPLSGNVSAYEWETLYCGYRYDAVTGLYIVRRRWFNPSFGSWCRSRDPIPFDDGMLDLVIREMDHSALRRSERTSHP